MKILVTGANGQLGKCLQDIAANYTGVEFVFMDRQLLPLDDFEKVNQVIYEQQPTAVINAAAYTAVDKAETETELAFLINGKAVGNLATLSKEINARFIHVSTDYVFDGNGTAPYKEDDAVSPVNAYGASKLEGEQLALQNNPDSMVVRTSWVYSRHANNFVKTMLRLMGSRPEIGVVADQIGCPTYAIDLAEALVTMATANEVEAGIYHFSNSGPISWHEFASTIRDFSGLECKVNAIPTTAFPTPAKRPAYSVMDNSKIQSRFSIVQKDWKQSLQQCLNLLKAES